MSALPEDVLSVGMEEIAAAINRETAKGSGRVVLIAPERIEALVVEAEARGAAKERNEVRERADAMLTVIRAEGHALPDGLDRQRRIGGAGALIAFLRWLDEGRA